MLAQALHSILERLDLPFPLAEIVGFSELDHWGERVVGQLKRAGLLAPAPPALSIDCPACVDGHHEEVMLTDDQPPRAVISCPDQGPTYIDVASLQQVRASLRGLGEAAGRAVGSTGLQREVLLSRVLVVGQGSLHGAEVTVFVARGLLWKDGQEILEVIKSLTGAGRAMVIVPMACPALFERRLMLVPADVRAAFRRGRLSLDLSDVAFTEAALGTRNLFRRVGDGWEVEFGGQHTFLSNSTGLEYLHRLVSHPFAAIHVMTLTATHVSSTWTPLRENAVAAGLSIGTGGDAGEVIDTEAIDAYRAQYEGLKVRLSDARNSEDTAEVEHLREEMRWLARELSRGTQISGQPRRAGAASEKARAAVTKAIKEAIARVRRQVPALGQHLDASIRTGTECSYEPSDEVLWETEPRP